METMIDISNTPSLKQLVYKNLQQMIMNGELKPGERITEDELAKAMSISRAPIREGLNMLERDGFVQIIPRKGAMVSKVTQKDVEDIWQCRMILEPIAARNATANIPAKEAEKILNKLENLLQNMDLDKYIESDLAVHELYYNYIDNQYMKSLLENIRRHTVRFRWLKEQKEMSVEDCIQTTKEHIKILEAIISRDEEAVYNAVYTHTQNSKDRVKYSVD